MKLGIMQPYFFPYIGYFHLITAVDKFILYDNVDYIRKGWIHRNRILEKWRGPVYCSVDIEKTTASGKIRDVRIDNSRSWRDRFLNQLYFNYKKAPFFSEIYSLVEGAIDTDTEYLADINANSITEIAKYLGISTEISTDVSRYDRFEDLTTDEHQEIVRYFRDTQGLQDIKTVRVLHICSCEQASAYINPIGGRVLYDKEIFAENRINLYFTQSEFLPYRQFADEFFPQMSIIDVLMHCGRDGTRQRLNSYFLV